ncbi:MAG: hypothetical protein JWO38_7578 [Gemmataceae bacterium]|nr:hypothetical protein [Gemmataceae bacterium]
MTACYCQFCAGKLEPAQEFRFLVETETLDDPVHLNRIRQLPATTGGRPLRVCKSCQKTMERHPVQFRRAVLEREHVRQQFRAAGVLAAVGILSAGWFLTLLLGSQRA